MIGVGAAATWVDAGSVGGAGTIGDSTATESPTASTPTATSTVTRTAAETPTTTSESSASSSSAGESDTDTATTAEPSTGSTESTAEDGGTETTTTAEPSSSSSSGSTGDSGSSGGDGETDATTESSASSSNDGTDTTTTETSSSTDQDCLVDPYDYGDEDEYEYDTYDMGMPDRFAEDILSTDGVDALYYGMEGQQAGLMHYAAPEAGADPVVYCQVSEVEGYVATDVSGYEFTPTSTRWTADPTYEMEMGISDQSVEWLLDQDHVERVEHVQSCDEPDACESEVNVHVEGEYPPPSDEYAKLLPDTIDGHEVNYVGDGG